MTEFYRQCELRRCGSPVDVAWIPEQYAQKGKWLRIKSGGKWENGWRVVEVYGRATKDRVLSKERDYLTQREASDA